MANHDLRSQANAADIYATLPGSGEAGPVVHNPTDMKQLVPLERPGCHPRRLLDQITHKKFRSTASLKPFRYDDFERYPSLDHANDPTNPAHRLVFCGNQSTIGDGRHVISSLCIDCHYHFVFTMTWNHDKGDQMCNEEHAQWPLPENTFPWHHLVWAGSEDRETIQREASKYYPLVAREFYVCVAPPCTFQLKIDVSEPRLDREEASLLMDVDEIREQIRLAREKDPTRYESATDDWAKSAPRNLNTYLRNMLDDNQVKRTISKRNKRFAVVFGPRCFDLFRRLEFQETVAEREDGEDEGTFTPLAPESSRLEDDDAVQEDSDAKGDPTDTEIGSYRAFIEDVRTEVQSLIHRMGDSEEPPSFISRVLHRNLGCSPADLIDRVLVDLERYKMLGILPGEPPEVVVNAYYRQWERTPESKKKLIEALKGVANDLNNDRLSEYAQIQSTIFESQLEAQGNANGEDEGTPLTRLGDSSLPVGLSNIGNTCYLNSLLQYLYTIKGVREIVNNFDKYKLPMDSEDDEAIKERKIGGNKMTMERGEVAVAQAFVQELAVLFHALLQSDKQATQPTQRLANAVLLPTRQIIEEAKKAEAEKQKQSHPPPLPARPPSAIVQPVDVTAADVSMSDDPPPLIEHRESSSNTSAITLVDDSTQIQGLADPPKFESIKTDSVDPSFKEDSLRPSTDVQMLDVAPEETQDTSAAAVEEPFDMAQKVLQALETQKRSSGTEQQDVEEVIGSIISLLQQAIRFDREDPETGIQYEKIMDTFFITTVNYTKKLGASTYQSEISYDRSITAFPSPDGESSLYDCLASNFDQQYLGENNLVRYSAIRQLPPILHILIQRTTLQGTKNDYPVNIPETLYLDRYMDVDQQGPDFKRRKWEWAYGSREKDIKNYQAKLDGTVNSNGVQNPTADDASDTSLRKLLGAEPGAALERLGSSSQKPKQTEAKEEADEETQNGFENKPATDAAETHAGVDGPSVGPTEPSAEANDKREDVAMTDDLIDIGSPEEDWTFDGPVEEDFQLISKKEPDVASQDEDQQSFTFTGYQEAENQINMLLAREMMSLRKRLNESHNTTRNHKYSLEAVICHRGRMSSGHYWVWIKDFADNVWRCYNDSNVKVYEDSEEVFKELNNSGNPYYLCYVRDEDKENWVSVPKREKS